MLGDGVARAVEVVAAERGRRPRVEQVLTGAGFGVPAGVEARGRSDGSQPSGAWEKGVPSPVALAAAARWRGETGSSMVSGTSC